MTITPSPTNYLISLVEGKTNFDFKKDEVKQEMSKNGDTCLFSMITKNSKYLYFSYPDIDKFIIDYNLYLSTIKTPPSFCEVINASCKPHKEFWDIDYKINDLTCNWNEIEFNLFNWFENVRNQSIRLMLNDGYNHLNIKEFQNSFMLRPKWVITKASSTIKGKISFHIMNLNCYFNKLEEWKAYYKLMKDYMKKIEADKSEYFKSIDFSMSSKDRNFRLIYSVKPSDILDENRILKIDTNIIETLTEEKYNYKIKDTMVNDDFYLRDDNIPTISFIQLSDKIDKIKSEVIQGNKKVLNMVEVDESSDNLKEKVKSLIDIWGKDKGDYENWIKVGFGLVNIFKGSEEGFELYDYFCQMYPEYYNKTGLRKKYDELCHQAKTSTNQIGFGTFYKWAELYDEFEEMYMKKYSNLYRRINIKKTYSANYTFDKKFVELSDYQEALDVCEKQQLNSVICNKSCCGSGKTFNLPNTFKPRQSILIISFRISLANEFYKKFAKYGFKLYNDKGCKHNKEFNSFEYPRLIISVDSLHKVIGKYDIVVLDEFCSIIKHYYGNTIKQKYKCIKVFTERIEVTPLIYCLDANLSDDIIDNFFEGKFIYKMHNLNKKYDGYNCTIIKPESKDKFTAIEQIIEAVKKNKKVVVPSNSSKFCIELQEQLKQVFNDEKYITCYTKENPCTEGTTYWEQFDVLIYSPTITAGVSYDILTYDILIGYFIQSDKTSDIDSCFQQLFRVRNLREKQMYLYLSEDNPSIKAPLSYNSLENYIYDKIQLGDYFSSIDRNCITGELIKNKGYYMFLEYLRDKNISKHYFMSYMLSMLEDCGFKYNFEVINCDKEQFKSMEMDIKSKNKELELKEAKYILQSELITEEIAEKLNKQKDLLDNKDGKVKLIKYNIWDTFQLKESIQHDDTQALEFIVNNLKDFYKFKSFKKYVKYSNIDECIFEAQKLYKNEYEEYISDIDNKSMAKLLYDEKHLKITYCLKLIKELGLSHINDFKTSTNQPFEKLKPFLDNYQKELKLLFPTDFSFDKKTYKNLKGYSSFVKRMLNHLYLDLKTYGRKENKNYTLISKLEQYKDWFDNNSNLNIKFK